MPDGTHKLIEVDSSYVPPAPRVHIIGGKAHENYRSPVDGTIITSRRQEQEYMRERGLVRPGDFGPNEGREHFDRIRQEKQDFYDGKSEKHKREVKKDIVQAVEKLQQGHTPQKEE